MPNPDELTLSLKELVDVFSNNSTYRDVRKAVQRKLLDRIDFSDNSLVIHLRTYLPDAPSPYDLAGIRKWVEKEKARRKVSQCATPETDVQYKDRLKSQARAKRHRGSLNE